MGRKIITEEKGRKTVRILIADDEEEMTQALSAILKHEHYSVDTVHDGLAALDYGMAESCDCLVLDIMMPGLDGLQVLRKLRENGISTPVLLLTAKGEVEDRVAGLDCGADDYLPKPFDVREFLARVRSLTRRGGTFTPQILTVGNVSLNRSTFDLSQRRDSRATGKQGISDDGASDAPSGAVHFHRTVYGADLGLRMRQ